MKNVTLHHEVIRVDGDPYSIVRQAADRLQSLEVGQEMSPEELARHLAYIAAARDILAGAYIEIEREAVAQGIFAAGSTGLWEEPHAPFLRATARFKPKDQH